MKKVAAVYKIRREDLQRGDHETDSGEVSPRAHRDAENIELEVLDTAEVETRGEEQEYGDYSVQHLIARNLLRDELVENEHLSDTGPHSIQRSVADYNITPLPQRRDVSITLDEKIEEDEIGDGDGGDAIDTTVQNEETSVIEEKSKADLMEIYDIGQYDKYVDKAVENENDTDVKDTLRKDGVKQNADDPKDNKQFEDLVIIKQYRPDSIAPIESSQDQFEIEINEETRRSEETKDTHPATKMTGVQFTVDTVVEVANTTSKPNAKVKFMIEGNTFQEEPRNPIVEVNIKPTPAPVVGVTVSSRPHTPDLSSHQRTAYIAGFQTPELPKRPILESSPQRLENITPVTRKLDKEKPKYNYEMDYFKISSKKARPGDILLRPPDIPGGGTADFSGDTRTIEHGFQLSEDAPAEEEKVEDPTEDEDKDVDDEDYDMLTGFFSDHVRRADLVLVMGPPSHPDVETIRHTLLLELAMAGFDLESEAGTLEKNSHLQFIKIHATDAVLVDSMDTLGVRKYFRESHEQFIQCSKLYFKFRDVLYEKEWLQTVRKAYAKPLQLSNLDRSYIVYMMLRSYSFGPTGNKYGLHRLIKSGVIRDAYALHDGPYYSRYQKDFTKYNCRQVLFANWVGTSNIFRQQPLNMINEYFGPKIAFYFAFYEFYIYSLVMASLWGIFMMFTYFCRGNKFDTILWKMSCKKENIDKDHFVCPECEGTNQQDVCPFILLKYYCLDVRLRRVFDNPYIIVYSAGLSMFALLFFTLWQRTERYWKWMWEEYYNTGQQIIRVESSFPRRTKRRFGLMTMGESIVNFLKKLAFRCVPNVFLPLLAITIVILVLIFRAYNIHYMVRPYSVTVPTYKPEIAHEVDIVHPRIDKCKEYGTMIGLTIVLQILFYILERIFLAISKVTTALENHRTNTKYEKALILNYFFYSVVFSIVFLAAEAWLKAAFRFLPTDYWYMKFKLLLPWQTYSIDLSTSNPALRRLVLHLLTFNCGHISCLRHALVNYITILIVRCLLDKIQKNVSRRGSDKTKEWWRGVPTAERESRLCPVTDDMLHDDFNSIFVQLALVMWFAPLFPLAPLIALGYSLLDIRHKAKAYLLHSRRPVLLKASGIGHWNAVLKIICFATPLCHALTIIRTEIFKLYELYKTVDSHKLHYPNFKLNDTKDSFTHVGYGESLQGRMSENCLLDGFYEAKMYGGVKTFHHTESVYFMKLRKTVFVFIYLNLFLCVGALVWRYVHGGESGALRAERRERTLRRLSALRDTLRTAQPPRDSPLPAAAEPQLPSLQPVDSDAAPP